MGGLGFAKAKGAQRKEGWPVRFEVENALRELDARTPTYFLEEIFHHGDLKVRVEAVKVLADLDPKLRTNRVLREWMKLTP
jgi:hypothetical protein